ncbi:MAG: tetratricopeptide repeat protein [Candidatus Omnitrophica bacterium]|nr:tetratricopeptide repeat protein [Candidatus Omnitrophota bacterium]
MFRDFLRCSAVFAVAWGFVSVVGVSRADTPGGIAHFIMGESLEYQGRLEPALVEYRKAALADPSAFPVKMRLGLACSQAGDQRAAVEAFNAALKLRPDDLEARYLLAVVYGSMKDFDNAARQYEFILQKFTTLEPQNVDFYIYLGQLYLTQGKVEKSVAQFEKALVLKPDNTLLLSFVGSYYLDHARRPEGVGLLKRCVAADPVNGDCLNALGYGYAEDGVNLDEAALLLKRALAIESENAAYLDSLGWVYYRQGNLTDALSFLQKAVDKEKDPTIFDHIGDVYQKMSRPDMALEAWRAALKLDGTMDAVRNKIRTAESAPKSQKP